MCFQKGRVTAAEKGRNAVWKVHLSKDLNASERGSGMRSGKARGNRRIEAKVVVNLF